MSRDLLELSKLVVGKQATPGRVVGIGGGRLRVATATGLVEIPGDVGLVVGNLVSVRDGWAFRVAEATDLRRFAV